MNSEKTLFQVSKTVGETTVFADIQKLEFTIDKFRYKVGSGCSKCTITADFTSNPTMFVVKDKKNGGSGTYGLLPADNNPTRLSMKCDI